MPDEASPSEIIEHQVEDMLIAGIRYQGKYEDCGKYFGLIGRKMGRWICGKPFNLYYDPQYKEENADIESCFPIRQIQQVEGVSVRMLPGGRCISLIHIGPYDQIGRSYEALSAYIHEKGLQTDQPIREIYHKGPGRFFKGNPQKYKTEIQMMISS